MIGIPQDDPSVTPPEKQRFDVCVQLPEFRNPSGHIGCQTIAAGTFGVGRHYGSFDNLADTYIHVYDSLVTRGKCDLRPQTSFEVYSYSHVKGDIRIHFTDVYLPVEKIKRNSFRKENTMSGFHRNEWIARSPKKVFDFITASENASKIVPSVKSMLRLAEGPVRVGTRYRETRLMNGKESHAELEIVGFEPNRKYVMKNVTEGVETVYRCTFQPEKDGTRIDLVCELRANGIKKLMLPLVTLILKKEDSDHLQKLKRAMENGS